MHIPRLNTELAAHIDQALTLAQQQDVHTAAHFLEARRVPFPLICRVLMEPECRRTPVDLTPPSS